MRRMPKSDDKPNPIMSSNRMILPMSFISVSRMFEACHPLLGARLRFRFAFLFTCSFRVHDGSGLDSADLFCFIWC